MKKRRTFAAGGIVLLAVAIAVIVFAFAASGGGGSTGAGPNNFGRSLARIRARNIQLQSMIVLLTEQRVRGYSALASSSDLSTRPIGSKDVPVAKPSLGSAPPGAVEPEEAECDPNYEGACLDPNASDYDCEGGDGNGPDYTGEVRVVGVDQFGLDADGDGIGCEPE
jgi:hypothetical protein